MVARPIAACAVVLAALLTAGCAHGAGAQGLIQPQAPSHAATKAIEEDEGKAGRTPAALLVRSIGCVEYEPQQRAPGVAAQGSCRIGPHRIYVQSFTGKHALKRYVQAGPGPKPTGADIIGPTWIVHVDEASFAPTVQDLLGTGTLVPAS